jgi:hypothetical protein
MIPSDLERQVDRVVLLAQVHPVAPQAEAAAVAAHAEETNSAKTSLS